MSEESNCQADAPFRRKVQRKMKTVADQLALLGVKRMYGILGAEDRSRFHQSMADEA
jgi:hypothetical protein